MPPPARVLWADLVERKVSGTRAWLTLLDDEQRPKLIKTVENEQVVWSSLWPHRPKDRIVLNVHSEDDGSSLEVVWLAGVPEPSPSQIGHIRKRLSYLLFAELRFSYGQ